MKFDEVRRTEIGAYHLHVVPPRLEATRQIEDVIEIALEREPPQVSPETAAFGVYGVANVGSDFPVGAAIHETDGGVVAVLHFAHEQAPVDGIVRHVDSCTERGAAL